ncbi:endogenous retrovirus group K member 8 Pol protein-like [Podarcis lilfordi]|uniref:Endogenous retrovirus group K member 8 Pol protein-like n=1 Tax=Podarcis lilfordi TaxID=74358 RepID=A0AA35L3F9_9SAUR|nr:endogenous retrovirus group K member 8 Pol protein-like [Podarcis lilfordi]
MDVTHTPLLAPFSKVHLTVDTSSGFIWATPLKGETARHVIQHTLRCFAVMGKPQSIKTDNGPAYISSQFSSFCDLWNVKLIHGLPFNSTGQAIVERAHLTFKTLLSKQLGGRNAPLPRFLQLCILFYSLLTIFCIPIIGNIHRLRFIFEKQSLWLGLLYLTDSYLIQHGMVLCHSSPGDAATRQWTWMDGLPGYQRAVCDPGELLPRNEIYDSD